MKNKFKVIGMMSGTSLDGLDIALCQFERVNHQWSFSIEAAQLIKYPKAWSKKLSEAHELSAMDLISLDREYGIYLGKTCRAFMGEYKIRPDFIASHGHTVFHQPKHGFTFQIGNGNDIFSITDVPVIYDFRSLDVSLQGQGAPLVPVGDKLLFADYEICLNLGGIANLSAGVKGVRKAFDVCFCNMAFNYLTNTIGKSYDKNGVLASSGQVNENLLKELKAFYKPLKQRRPSLGREFFEDGLRKLLTQKHIPLEDRLATSVESTAFEIATAAKELSGKSMLCTGGGAFNSFLISRILDHAEDAFSVVIPDQQVVKFKEAVVFAFLGVLRACGEPNCLKSVTGATKDNSGGVMVGFNALI
jgi:anhydro-N-acetylmuramic acid kinase